MDVVTANWNLEAEQATLGAMLTSSQAIDDVTEVCAPRDFHRAGHQVIAMAIVALHAAGEPADPVAVAAQLARDGDLARMGGGPYLHTLYASVTTGASAGYHARIVADYAARRRIEETGTRLVQRARQPGDDVTTILAGAEADLAAAITETETGVSDLVTVGEFCETPFTLAEWVIPGLLHAMERVIVVAGEGQGKSTLGRQIGVMLAAGIHPFALEPITPKRALLVDLENPPRLVQTKIRPLVDAAKQYSGWDQARLSVWCRPGGLDLSSVADQTQLRQVVKRAKPDLVVIGPLYKMVWDRGERAEQLHGAAARFLDQLRDRAGVALWIEAHAPMAQAGSPRDFRPFGSGVWQRWPEFGISLKSADVKNKVARSLELERFRGDRDERCWPEKLTQSRFAGGGLWPWVATYPPGTFADRNARQAA